MFYLFFSVISFFVRFDKVVVGLMFCLCFICVVFRGFLMLFLEFLESLMSLFLSKVICFFMEISKINRMIK